MVTVMTSAITLDDVDRMRRAVGPETDREAKAALGQFMTPSGIARFMANLFSVRDAKACHLLDAGAGLGALSCAFLDRWKAGEFDFEDVHATAYEVDTKLQPHLERHLAAYSGVKVEVVGGDYIELTTDPSFKKPNYSHAILNPPYKKINSASRHRLALRTVGIETVNLYSAFVALAVAQMAKGGELVAIIPRSFCNGPYYKPFRTFLFERAAIQHMHLFKSRSTAFKDDEVLQENIIIKLQVGVPQGAVTVSTSSDDTFKDLDIQTHEFERIVFPNDAERFIHVPTTTETGAIERSERIGCSPEQVGFKVSTGPVVGFRMRSQLRDLPEPGTVPLLYPTHFSSKGINIVWPGESRKKPSAIALNEETDKWLYPNGYYCLVRRFSSKEEKRRIVARVLEPENIGNSEKVGFENYFNVLHFDKKGLPKELAYGLTVFLNSTAVDESFRRFNGHTQVNATDLKLMKYPSRETLVQLGEWAIQHHSITQLDIDRRVEGIL